MATKKTLVGGKTTIGIHTHLSRNIRRKHFLFQLTSPIISMNGTKNHNNQTFKKLLRNRQRLLFVRGCFVVSSCSGCLKWRYFVAYKTMLRPTTQRILRFWWRRFLSNSPPSLRCYLITNAEQVKEIYQRQQQQKIDNYI